MSLFDPYSTELADGQEVGRRVEREHLDLGERLGYAILLSAGYAEADFVSEAEHDTVLAYRKRKALEEFAADRARSGDAEAGGRAADGEQAVEDLAVSAVDEAPQEADSTGADSLSEKEPEAGASEEDYLEPPGSRWKVGLHLLRVEHADLSCIGRSTIEVRAAYQSPIYTDHLTVALVAAEKYNRSSFQRRMEGWLARLSLRLRDKLPEYTYGLAQLRPSAARALLASEVGGVPLPDRELLNVLTSTCHSARLAEMYVDSLAREFSGAGSTDDVLERVIRAYNGASSETVHGMRYVDAVLGAYELLLRAAAESGRLATGDMASTPSDKGVACFRFGLGSPDKGSLDVGDGVLAQLDTAAASPAEAEITYYVEQSSDEGPAFYRERMMMRRREWFRSELLHAGFSAARIRWAGPEARLRLERYCDSFPPENDFKSPWGAAEVVPARPAADPDAQQD